MCRSGAHDAVVAMGQAFYIAPLFGLLTYSRTRLEGRGRKKPCIEARLSRLLGAARDGRVCGYLGAGA